MSNNDSFRIAVNAALLAGKEILKIYETDFSVEKKSDDSPLTRADTASNKIITNALKNTGLPVLSEEGRDIPYRERKNWDAFWLVDPLDGTKEFIKKNDEFTVNIALVKNNKPVMGIIYVPVLDILYFGSLDEGAFKCEKLCTPMPENKNISHLASISDALPLKNLNKKFTVVASRSHLSKETAAFIDQLKSEHGEVATISRGSSLKLCMVAEGRADIYPRFAPTSEWDTAAGHAIVLSAGGIVTTADGKEELSYNKEDLLNPWFIVKQG